MALKISYKDVEFGVGDRIRVVQRVKDGDKTREAFFEGMVLGIRGREGGKTFTVRRIGEAGVGIEKIFPLELPSIEKIIVIKRGIEGVRRAKLWYTRTKSPTEVDQIYKRAQERERVKEESGKIKSASKKKK